MEREQKLKGFQKVALERIYRLFELAQNEKDKTLQKRYVSLAVKIGTKCTVRFPTELKHKFCKKCHSINVTAKEEKPFLIIICKDCGAKRKAKPIQKKD
jgi:ribonuclease P protein subunit RPR2